MVSDDKDDEELEDEEEEEEEEDDADSESKSKGKSKSKSRKSKSRRGTSSSSKRKKSKAKPKSQRSVRSTKKLHRSSKSKSRTRSRSGRNSELHEDTGSISDQDDIGQENPQEKEYYVHVHGRTTGAGKCTGCQKANRVLGDSSKRPRNIRKYQYTELDDQKEQALKEKGVRAIPYIEKCEIAEDGSYQNCTQTEGWDETRWKE